MALMGQINYEVEGLLEEVAMELEQLQDVFCSNLCKCDHQCQDDPSPA